MAPTEQLADVAKRAYYSGCPSGTYYSGGYCYSSWSYWGRWVFAGIVVLFVVGLLLILGCVNSRRRRRRGLAPRYGTGWMANGPKYGAQQNNPQAYQAPPPQYAPPQNQQYTGQTYNSNEGYYHGQTQGVQQPTNSYYPEQRGGENVYSPPPGPPPGK